MSRHAGCRTLYHHTMTLPSNATGRRSTRRWRTDKVRPMRRTIMVTTTLIVTTVRSKWTLARRCLCTRDELPRRERTPPAELMIAEILRAAPGHRGEPQRGRGCPRPTAGRARTPWRRAELRPGHGPLPSGRALASATHHQSRTHRTRAGVRSKSTHHRRTGRHGSRAESCRRWRRAC
jgi:hypothetical protein